MIALYTALALVVGVAVAARRPVGGRKNLADVFAGPSMKRSEPERVGL
ncbi:hypothetical protein ACQGAO_30930 [Rhodococcus sp. 1.20]